MASPGSFLLSLYLVQNKSDTTSVSILSILMKFPCADGSFLDAVWSDGEATLKKEERMTLFKKPVGRFKKRMNIFLPSRDGQKLL